MLSNLSEILNTNRKRFHRTLLYWEPEKSITDHYNDLVSICPRLLKGRILWCYSKKHAQDINDIKQRLVNENVTFQIYNKDFAKNVLGKSFKLVIMQHYEALTANILCQAVDTCEGGGVVVLQFPVPLNQLPNVQMDIHKKWSLHKNKNARLSDKVSHSLFNKRFAILLSNYDNLSSCSMSIKLLPPKSATGEDYSYLIPEEIIDKDGILSHAINVCQTSDQAKGLLKLLDKLCSSEIKSQCIMTVIGNRGRGKSALVGIVLGTMLLVEWKGNLPWNSCISVTAIDYPYELFKFVRKVCEPYFEVSMVQDNRDHMQISGHNRTCVICYIHFHKLFSSCKRTELIVVDEAATIPLHIVDTLISTGFQRIIISGTCVGYEGSGARSLWIKQLAKLTVSSVNLTDPIRYGRFDPLEGLIQQLLCLDGDVADEKHSIGKSVVAYPPLDDTDLFIINKDIIFTRTDDLSSTLLSRIAYILNSTHYRNSPNDLQLLADCNYHHIAILASLKYPLSVCTVLHIVQEGQVTDKSHHQISGDLVPICLYNQFADDFWLNAPSFRIMRIATNPLCQGLGYGKRAIKLLLSRACVSLGLSSQNDNELMSKLNADHFNFNKLPMYVSVSFGLTKRLCKFWLTCGFIPLYVRSGICQMTGENSCIMVKSIYEDQSQWLQIYSEQFVDRFVYQIRIDPLRHLPVTVCQQLLQHSFYSHFEKLQPQQIERLQYYNVDFADHHLILDLISLNNIDSKRNYNDIQQSLFIGLGFQGKTLQTIAREIEIPTAQARALLNRAIRQVVKDHDMPSVNGTDNRKRNRITEYGYDGNDIESDFESSTQKRKVKNCDLDDVLS
ncbi:hypothetical protein GJ496_009521 [Pomphorhynchus laevis]|nr:hypothetical protein GJ496_009521 [Pomphorhynchus laevis]